MAALEGRGRARGGTSHGPCFSPGETSKEPPAVRSQAYLDQCNEAWAAFEKDRGIKRPKPGEPPVGLKPDVATRWHALRVAAHEARAEVDYAAAALDVANLPPDDRSDAERALGSPRPGRSALDAKLVATR